MFNHQDCHQLDPSALGQQFEQQQGWEQRYRLLLQLAKKMPVMPIAGKADEFKVSGCESQVWLIHQEIAGQHYFIADSDARLIKGLLTLMLGLANGKPLSELQSLKVSEILTQLQLDKHLSQSRNNGLSAVLDKMLSLAKESD